MIVALTFAAGLLLAQSAAGCMPWAEQVATLRGIGEIPIWNGIQRGHLWVLFTSSYGSWTLVLIKPGGEACRIIFGEGSSATPQPEDRT